MKKQGLLAGAVGLLLLAVATPASAKVGIAEAHISGPGMRGGGLRISGPATEGMWDSGIDVAGGLDDTRADSVVELGLTTAELGPRYVVTYRLDAGTKAAAVVRQELYPYAQGGPVTYVTPGQRVAEGLPWGGVITAGWYQSSSAFFQYLVKLGLPKMNPVAATADHESAPDTLPVDWPTPWGWIALALTGLVAALLAARRLRRRGAVAGTLG